MNSMTANIMSFYILRASITSFATRQCAEGRRYDDQSHSTDKGPEAKRGDLVTCPRSHRGTWNSLTSTRQPDSTTHSYPLLHCVEVKTVPAVALEAVRVLMPGGFSLARTGSYSLSVRDYDPQHRDTVKHYKIRTLDNGGFYISPRSTFSSLQELVAHYSSESCGAASRLGAQLGGPLSWES